jgi:hypothetical protein
VETLLSSPGFNMLTVALIKWRLVRNFGIWELRIVKKYGFAVIHPLLCFLIIPLKLWNEI